MLKEIVSLIETRFPYGNRESMESVIKQHMDFNTITIAKDPKGLSGVVRYNVNGECAEVLDLVVREDCEHKGVIKELTLRAWSQWPQLKFFTFKRKRKYPYRQKPRAYAINRMFHQFKEN